jgi:hypothetical protein
MLHQLVAADIGCVSTNNQTYNTIESIIHHYSVGTEREKHDGFYKNNPNTAERNIVDQHTGLQTLMNPNNQTNTLTHFGI